MFETSPYPGRRHWCDLCHGHLGPGSPCAPDPEPEQEPEPDEENDEMEDQTNEQTQPARPMRWPADFPGKHMAVLLLACIGLTACGGGGGGAGAEPEASCKRQPRIQLFGDSTMRTAAPYWIERWGDRIENRAKDGTGSAKLIAGRDRLNLPWPQSVTAPYYVVNHGMNDGWEFSNRNKMLTIPQYKANLRILAGAPGATAIFQTPNPSTREGRDMAPYAQAMMEVADEFGLRVIDVFTCFQTQENWTERIPDGTHPDEQGLRYIVEHCAAPIIEELPCLE